MMSAHRLWPFVFVALALVLAQLALAEIPGWQSEWPSPQQMLQGRDPAQVQQFMQLSAALEKNPKDTETLDDRGYLCAEFAKNGLYRTFWQWLAAKDLEQAIQLNSKDFRAWHNYGDLNYNSGDYWMTNDHSNAQRAVTAFTHAIALNPKSARSYMGRGWAYLTMDDQAHANADLQMALQLDPSLRQSIQSETASIQGRKDQEDAARGTISQMGRYSVERSARTKEECDRYIGYWTQGECRISQALNPGPVQPYEGQLRGGGSLR
jgi:tetratricopeptide (TPR) repeat protein